MMRIRLHQVFALLALCVAQGCKQAPEKAAPAKVETVKPDHVTRTTARAMCGQAKDRALAISQIAEEDEFSSSSDDVYSIASDLAEKGCPKAAQ